MKNLYDAFFGRRWGDGRYGRNLYRGLSANLYGAISIVYGSLRSAHRNASVAIRNSLRKR